jgi:trans-aconitate methyltransferase
LFYATATDLAAWSIKTSLPAILDLGAGTSLLSEFVMQRVKTASIYLLDESPDMPAKTQQRLAKYEPNYSPIDDRTTPHKEISRRSFLSCDPPSL